MSRTPTPVRMWVAVTTPPWGTRDYIAGWTIRRTRKEARTAYLAGFEPSYHRKALKHVRFQRVTVSVSP